MEKNIKMSLETARRMYKQTANTGDLAVYSWLLENFTKEELEGDEGYTWEKAFSGDGWLIDDDGVLFHVCNFKADFVNKNVFKTKAQAKSALAFAKLTHIVAKYNEGKEKGDAWWSIENHVIDGLVVSNFYKFNIPLMFFKRQDAETSLRVNRELWEQYHML